MLGLGRDELNALLGSRHASLYPPSRRRTFHDLPKLCGPADVRQGRRAALEHGEDRALPMNAPTAARCGSS